MITVLILARFNAKIRRQRISARLMKSSFYFWVVGVAIIWFLISACPNISCRSSVLEKASKSVWELILDNNGIGKEISETVEQVFCRLSGREAPLFVSDFRPQPAEKGKEKKSGPKEESSRETGKDNSESAAKKRKINTVEEFDEAGCKSSDKSPSSDDSSKMPPPSVRSQCTS